MSQVFLFKFPYATICTHTHALSIRIITQVLHHNHHHHHRHHDHHHDHHCHHRHHHHHHHHDTIAGVSDPGDVIGTRSFVGGF